MNNKVYLLALLALIQLASCTSQVKNENEVLKAEIAALAQENALLAEGTLDMASTIDDYRAALKEINQQIAAIDEKTELVKQKSPEFKTDADVETDILIHIEHLNHMMENSKHKISQLNQNVNDLRKASDADHEQIHLLEEELYDMAGMVVARDTEINALHEMLEAQGFAILILADAYTNQLGYSEVLLDILNTGFFVAGTKKELKEMGILDMEGGFLGIGRVKSLNANAPVQFFTPVDIRNTDLIELTGKGAMLVTDHPEESFEFTVDKDNALVTLGIANKLKFWQETNYLVIEVLN